MSVVCRMCLHQIYDESFVSVNDNSIVKDQLSECIPEMIMTLVTNPIICTSCTTALDFVFNFKSRCLQMERRILNHLNGAAPAIDGTQLVDILYASLNREIKCEIGDSSELDMAEESCLTATYCSNDELLTGGYAGNENSSEINFESMKHNAEELEFKPCQFVDASSIATMEDEADLCDTTDIFKNTNLPRFDEQPVSDSSIDSNKPWKNGLKGKHKGASGIPDEILLKSLEVTEKLIPEKSAERYDKEYRNFLHWKTENNVNIVTEEVILTYMLNLSKKMCSASLWPKYSMIKSMIMVHENVDISRFSKVITFLKKISVGYQPTQSKTLSREEINRFMKEAPDEKFLPTKVAAMIGIAGGCRREELHNMSLDDIQETGSQLVVTIPYRKTNQRRVFTILNEVDGINFLELFRRYIGLRPKKLTCRKLFIGYRHGKCIAQRIGIHTIGGMPKKIAQFLRLENPEKYLGHCFRRTSATLLAKAGADCQF